MSSGLVELQAEDQEIKRQKERRRANSLTFKEFRESLL